MKFGLRYCNTGPYVDPALAIELLQAGEEACFESAWTVEHTVVPEALELTVSMPDDVEDIPRLSEMGVDRVLVPVSAVAGLAIGITSPDDALAWRDTVARYS